MIDIVEVHRIGCKIRKLRENDEVAKIEHDQHRRIAQKMSWN